MKKVISTILALNLIISTPLSIFGNSIENIPPNNLESKTEVLNIDGENIKYTTSENKNSRIIKLSNFKKTEQHVVFYDKENSKLYLDSKEIEYTMTENNSKLINEKHINKKSKWRYLTTKKFKFNFKKEIAKSVLIGMIAALAGGSVGAFWGGSISYAWYTFKL